MSHVFPNEYYVNYYFFITEALFNKEKGDDILWKFGFIMHTTFITIQLIEITDWAQKKYNDQRPGISK